MLERTEEEIMQNWGCVKPFVSICSTTYNHEKYIAEAIEGFLIQETDFPFEILIRDDCSTDKTAFIIKQYADKYPTLIKAIYLNENTYSKGIKPMPQLYKIAKGKYIAPCEGDDYWIDTLKIQKQVEFLEKNHDFSFTFHNVLIYNQENNSLVYHREKSSKNIVYSSKDLLLKSFQSTTQSIMFRYTHWQEPKCFENLPFGDKSLEKLLALHGKGYYSNHVMAVYRNHSHGISKNKGWQNKMKMDNIDFELFNCLLKVFPKNKNILWVKERFLYHKVMDQTSFIKNPLQRFKGIYRISRLRSTSRLGTFIEVLHNILMDFSPKVGIIFNNTVNKLLK